MSAVDVDWGVVDSHELGEVVASGMSTITRYFPSVTPILTLNALSKLGSPVAPATGSLMDEVTGSFDNAFGAW